MDVQEKITAYVEKQKSWKKELLALLKIIRKSKMEEAIKWGMPTFMHNGKNILAVSAFKNYFGIWYFDGALLKDSAQQLQNAQSGKTIGMRQWRFTSMDDMDAKLIHQYNQEAITNQKAGKIIPGKKAGKKVIPMPLELSDYLEKDKKVAQAFEAFSHGRKNEIKDYIGAAKRAATRLKRLELCIPMILAGISPMDKYRKK